MGLARTARHGNAGAAGAHARQWRLSNSRAARRWCAWSSRRVLRTRFALSSPPSDTQSSATNSTVAPRSESCSQAASYSTPHGSAFSTRLITHPSPSRALFRRTSRQFLAASASAKDLRLQNSPRQEHKSLNLLTFSATLSVPKSPMISTGYDEIRVLQ